MLDVEDIHKCLQGNICRCTGYRPIVEGMKKCLEESKAEKNETIIPATRIQIEIMPTLLKNQFDVNFGFIPTNLEQVLEMTKKNPDYIFVQGGTGKYQMAGKKEKSSKFEIYLGHIQELKSAKVDPENGNVHVGSGLKLVEMEEFLKKNVEFCQPFLEAFGTLASPQIRNVATIGGSIFWRHTSSDLWPLYLIYECQVKILDLKNETESVISVQNIFEYHETNCLILELIIPNPGDSEIVGKFYKKARRSEFDLAILNVGILAKFIGHRIEFIKIAFGGSDNLLQIQSPESNDISLAKNTMNYLTNLNSLENISYEELMSKINIDLYGGGNHQEKTSNNVRSKHRISIALYFLKDFLTSFSKQNQVNLIADDKKYKSFKSMQINQEDEKGLKNGHVFQSVPHIWGQDLASGKAKFISDLPTYENELELILIRSSKSHAKIKTLDVNEALQMKGIIGCLTAKDLPESRDPIIYFIEIRSPFRHKQSFWIKQVP